LILQVCDRKKAPLPNMIKREGRRGEKSKGGRMADACGQQNSKIQITVCSKGGHQSMKGEEN